MAFSVTVRNPYTGGDIQNAYCRITSFSFSLTQQTMTVTYDIYANRNAYDNGLPPIPLGPGYGSVTINRNTVPARDENNNALIPVIENGNVVSYTKQDGTPVALADVPRKELPSFSQLLQDNAQLFNAIRTKCYEILGGQGLLRDRQDV